MREQAQLPSNLRMPKKPKLGQNFLRDQSAIERIAAALGDVAGQTVVEVGPGRGAITRILAERAGHVVAIELDRDLAASLRARFPAERITVVEQDVLQFDFAAASSAAGRRVAVVGNLPYYITSPILLKLAASHAALDRAVLMVQREVADRIVAAPGSRDYGLLSVTVQMYGPVAPLFTLPPGAFSPPPGVHSTVFRWRFAPRFVEIGVEEAAFFRFARQAFAQKRKTLANNMRAAGCHPSAALAAFVAAGIPFQARAEELPIEALAALHLHLEQEKADKEKAASAGEAAPSS
jgi:16S rRNA (adenine1518-N6/adenine1519-N6)-dimethyltransferase